MIFDVIKKKLTIQPQSIMQNKWKFYNFCLYDWSNHCQINMKNVTYSNLNLLTQTLILTNILHFICPSLNSIKINFVFLFQFLFYYRWVLLCYLLIVTVKWFIDIFQFLSTRRFHSSKRSSNKITNVVHFRFICLFTKIIIIVF